MSKEQDTQNEGKKDNHADGGKKDSAKKKPANDAEKIVELEQQAGEYLLGMKRLQAELENYRKRIERDQESFTKYASQQIIGKLLPVLENFNRVMETSKKAVGEDDEFRKAIDMVYTQLRDVLAKEGLVEIEATGKQFDPELHEPLLQEASDHPANTVIEVLQPGYKLHDRVIRHARVKLSKGKETTE